MSRTAAVVIGRNEGTRLERCLATLGPQITHLVYVDSGSTDQSVELATQMGAHVVRLDTSTPFTAARARNAGFEALMDIADPEFVQFIDGDCGVEQGWIAAAQTMLASDPKLGLVTGWRSEIFPDRSVYNKICDWEWRRPAGKIAACGGDMMVRANAFDDAGGFDPRVIAAEDDEFCQRLAAAGWGLTRIPVEMTRHDADMTQFSQWWRRAERSGHGFAQVGDLHPGYFRNERIRVIVFGGLLPVLALFGLLVSWKLLLLAALLYGASYARSVRGLERDGIERAVALRLAGLLSLSKLPNMIGFIRYYARKRLGRDMRLIEYK